MRGHGGHGLAKSGTEAELLLSRCSVRTKWGETPRKPEVSRDRRLEQFR